MNAGGMQTTGIEHSGSTEFATARPQVSVIIPTRNRTELLRDAIISVLEQTYQDFEIIVVDDASVDDGSERVVSSFGDHRIRYYRHNRARGGSAARNTGILNSTGDFLAFLDDDDVWLPEKLSRQMEILLASMPDVGAVYTGRMTVERTSGKVLDQHRPVKRGNMVQDLLLENCIGGASAIVLKRKCLEQVGMFDETLPCSQDYDLWLRVASAFSIECIGEPLFKYHIHQSQITTDLEALDKGLQLIVTKYRAFGVSRKYFSERYLELGIKRCLTRDIGRGRTAFMRALRLCPIQLRGYFNLCLTFTGPDNFRQVKDVRRRINAYLGR
jgi:glycosyltransferase involved in cell wall biosynthesis